MTKNLAITANVPVPDDEFERADVLAQIKPYIDNLRAALHEISTGEAKVTHTITSPRVAKEPKVTSASLPMSPFTPEDVDASTEAASAATAASVAEEAADAPRSARKHKTEHVAA